MNPRLQQKLYEDFPALFRQKDLSMMETCMCWGIDCGDGWYKLIADACSKWEILKKAWPGLTVELSQVKEKFGTLRLYHDISWSEDCSYDEFTKDFIRRLSYHVESMAESESESICEDCGEEGRINKGPWYWTKCKKHWEEVEYLIPYEEAYKYKDYVDYMEKHKDEKN